MNNGRLLEIGIFNHFSCCLDAGRNVDVRRVVRVVNSVQVSRDRQLRRTRGGVQLVEATRSVAVDEFSDIRDGDDADVVVRRNYFR